MNNKALFLLLLLGAGLVVALVRFYKLLQKRKLEMEQLGTEVALLRQMNTGLATENLRLKGFNG